ncbi:MAG: AAA family ATPase, partial [Armatimonadetes bacterium]|nr:AAA family ATPase [Armatimonadota bacterium]
MINLEGIIDNITYHSKETHYAVAKLKTIDNKAITITGVFPIINIGAHYRISGDWYFHNIYGKQFQVKNFEELIPQTLKGLERYLGSGLIKGIGKSTAEKLVKHFKFEILNILENNYQKLMEIPGIGEYKAQTMALSFSEHKELKKIINFLGEFDLSSTLAVKIYKYYGNNCISVLKNNPYQLADEIWGIGFRTADKIAQKIGLPKDSVLRINSGIIYVLKEALENGHLFLPKEELFKTASKILETNPEKIEDSLIKLKEDKRIIFDDQDIYFTPYFLIEKKIARRIADFKKIIPYAKPALEDWEILEKNLKIQLTFLQKQAVEESLQEGILILTGGPGTGKTTTIKTILEWAKISKLKISLAAPTGRAAKRLSGTTALEALTIHRLLEYNPSLHEFQRNEYHRLKSNLFIIDEVSMIDAFLFNSLLKALPLDSRLILVGDKDQLPSVGAGNILRDLIDSKMVKTIFLNQIFRQSEDSNIIINAHKINQGEMPDLYKKSKDFF